MRRGSAEGPAPPPLFPVSPVRAFLFHGGSDGIPFSVSCCLDGLLGNHWQLFNWEDFFFFSTVVWKVRGSAHGWYVFHIHIIIYETTGLNFVVFQHLNSNVMTIHIFECNYCPFKHNDLNLVSTMI